MNCLLIDQEGLFLDLALRLSAHDNAVKWFRYQKPGQKIRDGEGVKGFEIVDDWRPHMGWAKEGLIVCSGNFKYLAELDRYRDLGFKIFAPTVQSAALEIQRAKGMDAMKAAGIDIPPYETFDSLGAAEKHVRKTDKAYVFKPMGDEEDKSLTYVAKDPADLVGWIQRQITKGKKLKGQCMLQEKIDMLCDFGVSGWFGPEGFLPGKWQICFEHKKLMDGEIGPATGEQGTVCQYVEEDKLAECLKAMEPILRTLGHRGDFSIGAAIDTKGKAWPLEFTARCGWPAFYIQTASHKGDPAKWMRDLLDGKDSLKVSYDCAIGVVLSQPRYPYNNSPPDLVEGNPISGVEEVYADLHLAQVMMGKGPRMENGEIVDGRIYQTSGEYVMVATGLGESVIDARKSVYKTVKKVSFPNMMYRTDIGLKIENPLPTLQEHGFAREMRFD